MDEIFATKSLAELQQQLAAQSAAKLRPKLIKQFLKFARYKNADEWNRAVRLCEALAIVGWGDCEPVEAERGKFFNGNPLTGFFNRFSKPRFVSAIWSKRKAGFTMEPGRTSYHASPDLPELKSRRDNAYPVRECIQNVPLATQRNWIPKNPIWVRRGLANCYPNSKELAREIDDVLSKLLDRGMKPERYGVAINRIVFAVHLSYALTGGGGTNYVLLDEDEKVSSAELYARLKTMYSESEIRKHGYYLRKRIDYGGFRGLTGLMNVDLHFTREFSEQPFRAQKKQFAATLAEAVNGVTRRLEAKRLAYDSAAMSADFQRIVAAWAK